MATTFSSIAKQGTYEPFELQVGRGQIAGHQSIFLFGYSVAIPNSGFIPAWENISAYTYPSSAVAMTVVSTSASDTATQIVVIGLDASYNVLRETITLTGTTGVVTTGLFLRINQLDVIPGTPNPVGVVTAKNGGVTYGQIAIGTGQSNMSIITVPAGYTLYGSHIGAWSSTSVTSGVYATFRAISSAPAGTQFVVSQAPFLNTFEFAAMYPLAFPEKTDVQFQFKSSGAGLAIGTIFEGLLIKNDGQA
ncbi:hypothetical protein UFOVP56_21 [uncultured Caudovirales phage]|uniref:Uncharacterized protein n=1 Tax=uncultured Caudovirales phage TaxID=2100421 RepID=A0A6J5T855_9CAUD|nr:hypothetical protein UFOVP56_21 [uncultured Caudovirales phage]